MMERTRVLYVGEDAAASTLADTGSFQVDAAVPEGADATGYDCVVVGESVADPTAVVDDLEAEQGEVLVFSTAPVAADAFDRGADDYVRAEGPERWTVLANRVDSTLERARNRRWGEERVQQVYERTTEAVFALDTDWRVAYTNASAAEFFGYDPEAFVGTHFYDDFDEEPAEVFKSTYQRAMETQEPATFVAESKFEPGTWLEVRVYPSETGLSIYFRDVTERRRRERELATYKTIVDAAPDPIYTLDAEGRFGIVNEAAAELVGFEREELVGESIEVLAEAGVVTPDTVRKGRERVEALDPGERARFEDTIHGGDRTVDNNLVKLEDGRVVNIVRDVTTQKKNRQALARQRDELETLNRINEVIRTAIGGLVGETSKKGVEHAVCRGLVESDLYRSAWIGETADDEGTVKPRTKMGEWTAGEPPPSITHGPAITAIETGEVQHVDDFAPLAEGESASTPPGVAVPLSRGSTVDGVLTVCADRPDAFSHREQSAFGVLGAVLGFAMTAAHHQELLFDNRVVELEFDAHDPRSAFVHASMDHDCRISNRGFIPTDDGGLTYVNVEGADPEVVLEQLLAEEGFEAGRVVSTTDDGGALQIRHEEGSMLLLLTEHGAKVREAVSEGGETRIVADVPPGADVRAIVDRVQASFPEAELVGKRRRERSSRSEPFDDAVESVLTERQHTALRAAHLAGYYDWPRDSTAEEIAESMEITAATLHQHLRAAEGKLLAALFETDP